eukprot:11034608-Alexandrium_andersonii.AAC.1
MTCIANPIIRTPTAPTAPTARVHWFIRSESPSWPPDHQNHRESSDPELSHQSTRVATQSHE